MVNFQREVIEQSFLKPVLVDFWAPWCGPCRVLGPILEQIAEEHKDRFVLVKVNTEEQPELAQQYRIMGIPNVKLFVKGKVVNEFSGALPRQAILKWLDENIPSEAAQELKNILAGERRIPDEALVEQLRTFLQKHPSHDEAKVALARHVVFHTPDEAEALVAHIRPGHELWEKAEDIRTLARLMRLEEPPTTQAASLLAQAREALKAGQIEKAIQLLIDATSADKACCDELPRKAGIALFRTLGNEHELTRKYRRMFDMVLW